jgi:hypothetical protein
VTVVQRFGSALNLTPHFHMLAFDRVYAAEGEEARGSIRCVRRSIATWWRWPSGLLQEWPRCWNRRRVTVLQKVRRPFIRQVEMISLWV